MLQYSIEDLKKDFEIAKAKAKKDPHILTDLKPLFNDDGSFNTDNWNSSQDDVRAILYKMDVMFAGNEFHEVLRKDDDDDNFISCTYLHVYIDMTDDQWHIFIHILDDEAFRYDTFVVSWYKSRGNTEMISKNGKPITFQEYVDMLNELCDFGYFNPKKWRK